MNVILLEKITNLGDIGETAAVKSGFARNFLFPQGKAIPATKANLENFEERKSELMAAHNANVAIAEARKAKVHGMAIKIEVNASEEGRLFGSVGTKDVADVINSQADAEILKSEVMLPHGVIRDLGMYEISLDLGHDVGAEITIAVVAQNAPAGVMDDGSLIDEVEEIEQEELAEIAAEMDVAAPEPVKDEDKSAE